MKNFKLLQKLVFFMVFGLTLCTLQACSDDEDNSPKHKLVGAWTRNLGDGRSEIYEFDKDGTFREIILFDETQTGIYTVNNKLGTLTLSYSSGGTYTWLLTELNNSYFIMMSTSTAKSYTYNRREVDPKGTYDTFASVKVNGYEAVDLGLSVMWATCNVGSTSWEKEGGYYAWGETSVKEEYSKENYKWGEPHYDSWGDCYGISYTKYCTHSHNGYVDNKTTLEAYDDVATVKCGRRWRMPTKEEFQELCEKCTTIHGTRNGVAGVYYLAKNGNYIFLPDTGYKCDGYKSGVFDYWTSSLGDCYDDSEAWYFDHDSWGGRDRYEGRTVRPVCK